MDRGAWQSMGHKKSDTTEQQTHTHRYCRYLLHSNCSLPELLEDLPTEVCVCMCVCVETANGGNSPKYFYPSSCERQGLGLRLSIQINWQASYLLLYLLPVSSFSSSISWL